MLYYLGEKYGSKLSGIMELTLDRMLLGGGSTTTCREGFSGTAQIGGCPGRNLFREDVDDFKFQRSFERVIF